LVAASIPPRCERRRLGRCKAFLDANPNGQPKSSLAAYVLVGNLARALGAPESVRTADDLTQTIFKSENCGRSADGVFSELADLQEQALPWE